MHSAESDTDPCYVYYRYYIASLSTSTQKVAQTTLEGLFLAKSEALKGKGVQAKISRQHNDLYA